MTTTLAHFPNSSHYTFPSKLARKPHAIHIHESSHISLVHITIWRSNFNLSWPDARYRNSHLDFHSYHPSSSSGTSTFIWRVLGQHIRIKASGRLELFRNGCITRRKPSNEFEPFAKLPPELRLEIWRLSFPYSRKFEIQEYRPRWEARVKTDSVKSITVLYA